MYVKIKKLSVPPSGFSSHVYSFRFKWGTLVHEDDEVKWETSIATKDPLYMQAIAQTMVSSMNQFRADFLVIEKSDADKYNQPG